MLFVGNGLTALGVPCRAASSCSRISTVEPLRTHWAFAAHAAMALIVIVLCTLTVAALEVFLPGDESLSALEAVIGG